MENSRTHYRVEYVFGHMTNAMGDLIVRCIGIIWTRCAATFKDFAYNFQRTAYMVSLPAVRLKMAVA